MNKEINFELAKLLKEKGFDKPSYSFYVIDESEYGEIGEIITNPNDNYPALDDNSLFDTLASAPTIAEVVMWLYEKHGIWVRVEPDWDGDFWVQIKSREIPDARIGKWQVVTAFAPYKSPTEAYEKAIEYCLNKLI